MAEPLRKAAGGYDAIPLPRQTQSYTRKPDTVPDSVSKRLVARQIRSNAEMRRAGAWVFLGMASILFLMSISSIFVKARVSGLNYSMNTLQSHNEQILLDNEEIRKEIAQLRSLDRILDIATRDLGMIKNENVDYMVMSTTIVAEGKIRSERPAAQESVPEPAAQEEESLRIEVLDRAKAFVLEFISRQIETLSQMRR